MTSIEIGPKIGRKKTVCVISRVDVPLMRSRTKVVVKLDLEFVRTEHFNLEHFTLTKSLRVIAG